MEELRGVPIGQADMHGVPVFSGDVLTRTSPVPVVFEVKLINGRLVMPVLPSDIPGCEVIKRWSDQRIR
jgi:hypothetical protein